MRWVISSILLLLSGIMLGVAGLMIYDIAPKKWCTWIPVPAQNFMYCEWRSPDVTQVWLTTMLVLITVTLFMVLGSVLTAPKN